MERLFIRATGEPRSLRASRWCGGAVKQLVPQFDPKGKCSVENNIEWTEKAMGEIMDVNEKDRIDILIRYSHRIPGECLEDLEEVWEMDHDTDELHESSWNRIIWRPIMVELVNSVLRRDNCRHFRIILPEHVR